MDPPHSAPASARLAPAVEIDFAIEDDVVHRTLPLLRTPHSRCLLRRHPEGAALLRGVSKDGPQRCTAPEERLG